MSETSSILVSGASGFIGRAVARESIRAGHKVAGVARSGCAVIPCVSTSFEVANLTQAIEQSRPAAIIHAVGRASVLATEQDEAGSYCDTVVPLASVLEAVVRSKHRCRVVMVSSAAVYGEPGQLPISELAPLKPISAYGRQRIECERLARDFALQTGLPVISARAFSLFGEEQKRLLVWELFQKFMQEREIVIQGTGDEMRDFMHVDAFARGLLALASSRTSGFVTVNVASGIGTSVKELVGLWSDVLSIKKPLVCLGRRAEHDPAKWKADVCAFERLVHRPVEYDLRADLAKVAVSWR